LNHCPTVASVTLSPSVGTLISIVMFLTCCFSAATAGDPSMNRS
jgi:hypothetical protein